MPATQDSYPKKSHQDIGEPIVDPSWRLVVFVGPSGSGKDTLMVKSRDKLLAEGYNVHIVRRSITRPSDHNEAFESLTRDQFIEHEANGRFILSWDIYGNQYGIPREQIDPYIMAGHVVLVNLSRAKTLELKQHYPEAKLVLVKTPSETAKKRIENRKRDEPVEMLVARLKRFNEPIKIPFPELVILNDGSINASTWVLVEFLRSLASKSGG